MFLLRFGQKSTFTGLLRSCVNCHFSCVNCHFKCCFKLNCIVTFYDAVDRQLSADRLDQLIASFIIAPIQSILYRETNPPMWNVALLVALVLVSFCVESSSANATGEHIYLSCAQGHSETVRTYEDGRVEKESRDEPFSYPVDIDLEHGTINYVFHFEPLPVSAAVIVGNAYHSATEYDLGYHMQITTDRLSGQLQMTNLFTHAFNCVEQYGKSSCKNTDQKTIYQCFPASPRF